MDYLIHHADKQEGPYPATMIIERLARGELSPGDLCFTNGMSGWKPISSVSELTPPPARSATPPPLSAEPPPLDIEPPKESFWQSTIAKLGVTARLTQKQAMRKKLELSDLRNADCQTGRKAYAQRIAPAACAGLFTQLDEVEMKINALREEKSGLANTFGEKAQVVAQTAAKAAKLQGLYSRQGSLLTELGVFIRKESQPPAELAKEVGAAAGVAAAMHSLDREIEDLSAKTYSWARQPLWALIGILLIGAGVIAFKWHQSSPLALPAYTYASPAGVKITYAAPPPAPGQVTQADLIRIGAEATARNAAEQAAYRAQAAKEQAEQKQHQEEAEEKRKQEADEQQRAAQAQAQQLADQEAAEKKAKADAVAEQKAAANDALARAPWNQPNGMDKLVFNDSDVRDLDSGKKLEAGTPVPHVLSSYRSIVGGAGRVFDPGGDRGNPGLPPPGRIFSFTGDSLSGGSRVDNLDAPAGFLCSRDFRRGVWIESGDVWRGDIDWNSLKVINRKQVTTVGSFTDQYQPFYLYGNDLYFRVGNNPGKPYLRLDLAGGQMEEMSQCYAFKFMPYGFDSKISPHFCRVVSFKNETAFIFDMRTHETTSFPLPFASLPNRELEQARDVVWDGDDILYLTTSDGFIVRLDLVNRQAVQLSSDTSRFNTEGLSPGGRFVALRSDKERWLVALGTGERQPLPVSGDFKWIDGSRLVYLVQSNDASQSGTYLYDAVTQKSVRISASQWSLYSICPILEADQLWAQLADNTVVRYRFKDGVEENLGPSPVQSMLTYLPADNAIDLGLGRSSPPDLWAAPKVVATAAPALDSRIPPAQTDAAAPPPTGPILIKDQMDYGVSTYGTNGELLNKLFLSDYNIDRIAMAGEYYLSTRTSTVTAWDATGRKLAPKLIQVHDGISDIAISGNTLFVLTFGGVSTYTTSGALINDSLIDELGGGERIDLCGNRIFILAGGDIREYALNGQPLGIIYKGGQGTGVADIGTSVDSLFALIHDTDRHVSLIQFDLSGKAVRTIPLPNLGDPLALAVRGPHLLVGDWLNNTITVHEYALDGTPESLRITLPPYSSPRNFVLCKGPAQTGAALPP